MMSPTLYDLSNPPTNEQGKEDEDETRYIFQVERFRLFAYVSFWFMCFFAMTVTSLTVAETLGPCPKEEGAEPTYGLHCSGLVTFFGFNNICVNWDYSPAREVTALVYPLFEYSLLLYVVVNYLQIRADYDKSIFTNKPLLRLSQVLFWVKIVLIAWFRMIFVVVVDQDPIPFFGTKISAIFGHTLGFLGLQVALILVAFENVLYQYYSHGRVFGLSARNTKIAAAIYLVLLTALTIVKLTWTLTFFATGNSILPGLVPRTLDRIWMVLVAVLPIFFAINGIRVEPDFHIVVENKPRASREEVEDEQSGEEEENFADEINGM